MPHVLASWQTTFHMCWLLDRSTCHIFWLLDRQRVTCCGFMTDNMSHVLASWQTNVSHVLASWQTNVPHVLASWQTMCHMFWLHDRKHVTCFGFMTDKRFWPSSTVPQYSYSELCLLFIWSDVAVAWNKAGFRIQIYTVPLNYLKVSHFCRRKN